MEKLKLSELDPSECMYTCKDEIIKKYNLPSEFAKEPDNKDILFEEPSDIYKPNARMVSFKTTPERLPWWVASIETRYWEGLGKNKDFIINWRDHRKLSKDKDLIQVDISSQSLSQPEKLFTISIHLTTGCITCQGTQYIAFKDSEFGKLLKFVKVFETNKEITLPKEVTFSKVLHTDKDSEITFPKKPETDDEITHIKAIKELNTEEDKFIKVQLDTIINSLSSLESKYCNFIATQASTEEKVKTLEVTLNKKLVETVNSTDQIEEKVKKMGDTLSKGQTKTDDKINKMNDKMSQNQSINEEKINNMTKRLMVNEEKIKQMEEAMKKGQPVNNDLKSDNIRLNEEIKILRQEIKDKNSVIQTLKEPLKYLETENSKLRQETIVLHQEIEDKNSEIQLINLKIKVTEQENTTLKEQLKSDWVTPITRNKVSSILTTPEVETEYINIPDEDVTIISDSHGKQLDGEKLYRYKKSSVHILDNKTTKGAKEFIERNQNLGSNTVIVTGSNDLTDRSVEDVIEDTNNLIQYHEENFPNSKLHIFPAIHRLNNKPYNDKVNKFNKEIFKFQSNHTSIIRNTELHELNPLLFAGDNVHFNKSGNLALVDVLKSHLNPVLGLLPYVKRKSNESRNNAHNQNYPQHQEPNLTFKPYNQNSQHYQGSNHYQTYKPYDQRQSSRTQNNRNNVKEDLMKLISQL